jgi:hypothetical protein
MRASLLLSLALLAGCVVHPARQDTVLVRRGQPAPLLPPPPDDSRQGVTQGVLSDPLPNDTLAVLMPQPPLPSVSISAAPGLRFAVVAQWTQADLVPFQEWHELPGTVTGLIWMAGPQAWGAGYEHFGGPSQQGDRDEYKFGVDGTSPYAVYFVSDGRGYNYLTNWSGGGRGAFDAAMFDCDTPNAWGLSRRAHVVEVDVNGRQGAPPGVHFVVTNARVLDGTSAFPPRADEVLLALRRRFDAVLADERPELDGLYASAARAAGGEYSFGARTNDPIGVFPTWRRDAQAMEVVFTAGSSGVGRGPSTQGMDQCPHCPPGAPCMRCDPSSFQLTPTAVVKVTFAVRYRVDARGLIVAETRYAGRVETTRGAARDGSGVTGVVGGDY